MLCTARTRSGLLFHTAEQKDLYRQVGTTPCRRFVSRTVISRCGYAARWGGGGPRAQGEMVEAREFLQAFVYENGFDLLKVLRMKNCVATLWTFDLNFMPKVFVELF